MAEIQNLLKDNDQNHHLQPWRNLELGARMRTYYEIEEVDSTIFDLADKQQRLAENKAIDFSAR